MNVLKSMPQSPVLNAKPDRLTVFFEVFRVSVSGEPACAGDVQAMLYVIGTPGKPPESIMFCPRGDTGLDLPCLVSARVGFENLQNPLISALPDQVLVEIGNIPAFQNIAAAFLEEALGNRCGRCAALNRLCEVMLIFAMRSVIARGASGPGLLAGLAHPALSRALLAMHDVPARAWQTADLAAEAGMSRSHFMASFREVVGMTPCTYLTNWRLSIAQRELSKGCSVKSAARLAGFSSAAALSRAYFRKFGIRPSDSVKPAPALLRK